MNLYYAIYGNEAKIIDENENKTTREVTKNFHKILEKENEIEERENQLEEANKTINEEKDFLKFNKRIGCICILAIFLVDIICFPVSTLLKWDLSALMSFDAIGGSLFFTLIGCGLTKIYQDFSKDSKRKLHAAELQTYFLEKEIPIKKQELEDLKQNDKELETPIEQLGMEKVEDRETLLKLKEYLEKLEKYGESLPKQADKYARGLWSEEDRENVQNDGIDADLFEQYLNEYNTRKLMKGKRTS